MTAAEPMILNNTIIDNEAITSLGGVLTGLGGGIYCSGGGLEVSPVFDGNLIQSNRTVTNGGGIAILGSVAPIIRNNVIRENETLRGDGAGISLFSNLDGSVLVGNHIEGNNAGDHGGAVHVVQENPLGTPLQLEISWNVIVGNVAKWQSGVTASGGGLWLNRTEAWIHHNSIISNQGGEIPGGTSGGSIAVINSGTALIEQNVFAFSVLGGGIHCAGDETPIFQNNLAWQNIGGEGNGTCQDWWQTNGNLVGDPYFCSPELGDFYLAQNSPALLHPAGPLGALSVSGCGPVDVRPVTWGQIKAKYN